MKAVVEVSPVSLMVSIYVTHQNFILEPDGKTWTELETGVMPDHPTFWMSREVWEAILREAVGPTPNDAVLQDTMKVRDRLLTMIESEWNSRQLENR